MNASLAPHPEMPRQGAWSPSGVLPFGARPVQDWLALSGKGLVDIWANPFAMMKAGRFVAELRLPLPKAAVLVNLQTNEGVARSFSVFAGPDGSLSILHREGTKVQRHYLPPASPLAGETARLSFHFDAPKNIWSIKLEALDIPAAPMVAQGTGAMPFVQRDIESICKKASLHPAVLWFGFCHGDTLPKSAPWIGLRTPIETTRGSVAAGNLKAGDVVITQDRGPQTLQALHRLDLPARGSFAPVLLRAPFYDCRSDILVSADQRVALSGSAVEYLFGQDSVLVAARDLVDGRTALAEDRRNVISAVSLDLGGAALVSGPEGMDCVTLALGDIGQTDTAPLTCLNAYETIALMRMMGRIVSKVA